MTRKEILQKITALQIERDECLGNYASHSLDLSDSFARARKRFDDEIRKLQQELPPSPEQAGIINR